ncbi:beta-1,3-galactosyl-O-glycosyl-glycoprotein beta-1,6-N-acetylglucosaminyltransferase [Elysia marginata]|uniref:Beta-1,3-galactosyl-O-glycosyl-glycoprotein beta-1,6-N-acetylglucosaminyltransferase n=1 Tax=Elysia marginata TaxID=1093978 RepID=A0AAV4EIC5_9GAST|nr:beta-1,3-galactosyl-O-glycosyl-glycoprotein beta-1,6-N-acetylglucosaminyltransferase [Elysia marginata]
MQTDQSETSSEGISWACLHTIESYRKIFAGITLICLLISYALFTNGISLPRLIKTPLKLRSYPFFPSEVAGKYQQTKVNCSAVIAGDEIETKRAATIARLLAVDEKKTPYSVQALRALRKSDTKYVDALQKEMKTWSREFQALSTEWYLNATQDCEWFKRTRGYIMSSLTQQEAEFPIAFSLMVYTDLEMMERLLRIVYRPQNFYCIHVDRKSKPMFYRAVKALVGCFPHNVRVASRRINVLWGNFSVLEPELVCMKDLWDMDTDKHIGRRRGFFHTMERQNTRRKKWKYFINLTGQEFPLMTNYELVKVLQAFKGANNVEGTRARVPKNWWKTSPPHGIIPTKGSIHAVMNRATVDFILHDYRIKDFLKWLNTTKVPDETMFASLNYNPQLNIPGTYNGANFEKLSSLTRYKIWISNNLSCASGQIVRHICILSTGDLPRMTNSPAMFANKFFLHQDRVAIGCLEERLYNNTRDECLGLKSFNTSFYEKQDFVLHQVPPR